MSSIFGLSENIRNLLPLIYIIPSYFLYFIILYILFFSKVKHKFSGSFYKLFGAAASYYLSYSIIYYLYIRVPAAPIFSSFVKIWDVRGFIPTFLQTSSFYLLNCTHLFSASLSFNRFTIFGLRVKYQNFWDKYLKFIIGFCCIFPLGLVWHIPFTDIYMQLANESDPNGRSYVAECHPEIMEWMNNPRNTAILISITASFSLIMNIYVIARMLEQKFCYGRRKQIMSKVSPQDIKISIFTMLIFATEVINGIQHYAFITIYDMSEEVIDAMFEIQAYLIDITTLAPAWYLLIANKNLRKQIGIYLFKTKPEIAATTFRISVASKHLQTNLTPIN